MVKEKIKFAGTLIGTMMLGFIVYILLHEFGHTIVLLSVHAKITEFSLLRAHVLSEGGSWTDFSDKWMHLNGPLFPVIIFTILMLLYRSSIKIPVYRTAHFFMAVMSVCTAAFWSIAPLVCAGQIESWHQAGKAPYDEDVLKFIYNFAFDYPVWLVSIAAAAVTAASFVSAPLYLLTLRNRDRAGAETSGVALRVVAEVVALVLFVALVAVLLAGLAG